jgi:aspartate dehydrogenase
MEKIKLALLGGGYLNEIVATALQNGYLPEYELIAVLDKKERADVFAKTFGCQACYTIDALLAEKPQFIAEAASVEAVTMYAEKILSNGANLVVLSIGAFADTEFFQKVKKTATDNLRKVYIASGAVGGFDVLRTASLMSSITASFTSLKSPAAVSHTALNFDGIMEIGEQTEVFRGTAKEAIAVLPTHVNVAVASALASAGTDKTMVDIQIAPGFKGDEHRIQIEGDEVRADLKIYSRTSAIAAWSVVATLQNIVSPVEFF